MSQPEQLITEHIDIWTSSILAKSTVGRGSSKKYELYGIKKLRELILELAVRGKLVAQDDNAEPASIFLEKMEIIKQGLIEDKKIKRPKNLADVSDDEYHFETPQGWCWVRLNDVGEWGAGATPSRSNSQYYGGGIPWFKSGELSKDYISESQETITELALKETSLRENKPGDVLLAMYGATIGKASILEVASTTNQAVCACTPFPGISNTFLLMLLKAYRSRFINMGAGGAQPNISREKIIATVIALPPKEEQNRIVAKVDELMLLCDQLEQQTEASIDAHATLVDLLLTTLTDSNDANDLAQNWVRLSEYFDTLFTTDQSIEALKQTVLQLAVMGKLVPQNPEDEPASVLLEKIKGEKAQLIKDKVIKKEKTLPTITDYEKLFELPSGWEFSRLQQVIDVRDGTHDSPKDASGKNTFPLVTSKDFQDGAINFDTARRISEIDHIKISQRSSVDYEDILFSMIGGNIGNQVMVLDTRPFSIKNVALFKYYNKKITIPNFFKLYTEFTACQLQNNARGGAQPFVSLGYLRSLVFALPPVNEQHRIVAKVDELMAICDQLKERLKQSQETQVKLTDALIEKALA